MGKKDLFTNPLGTARIRFRFYWSLNDPSHSPDLVDPRRDKRKEAASVIPQSR